MFRAGSFLGLGLGVAIFAGAFAANVQPLSAGGPEAKTKVTATNVKCKGCVGGKDVGKNAIKSKNIKDGQVTSSDLGGKSVTLEKLDDSAKSITAAAGRSAFTFDAVDTSVVLNTIDLAVPGSGVVVTTFSVPLYFITGGQAQCLVFEGASPPLETTLPCVLDGTTGKFDTCAGVQPIPVSGPGTVSLKLRCEEFGAELSTGIYSFVATYSQKAGTMDIKSMD